MPSTQAATPFHFKPADLPFPEYARIKQEPTETAGVALAIKQEPTEDLPAPSVNHTEGSPAPRRDPSDCRLPWIRITSEGKIVVLGRVTMKPKWSLFPPPNPKPNRRLTFKVKWSLSPPARRRRATRRKMEGDANMRELGRVLKGARRS